MKLSNAAPQQSAKDQFNKPLILILTALAMLGLPLIDQSFSLSRALASDSCHGLHAGIDAEFNSYTEQPSIQINFVLLNDAELPLDSSPGSWEIVINGKDVENSAMILGNGPGPVGGYGVLNSGRTFGFGKALPIMRYFPEHRDYTVSWSGKGFQSPTIKVRGGLPQ